MPKEERLSRQINYLEGLWAEKWEHSCVCEFQICHHLSHIPTGKYMAFRPLTMLTLSWGVGRWELRAFRKWLLVSQKGHPLPECLAALWATGGLTYSKLLVVRTRCSGGLWVSLFKNEFAFDLLVSMALDFHRKVTSVIDPIPQLRWAWPVVPVRRWISLVGHFLGSSRQQALPTHWGE